MNYRLGCAVLVLFGLTTARADDPLSLDGVLLRARDQNPEIQSALQAWKVKQAEVRPSAAWPNPDLSYINEEFPSGSVGVRTEKIQHYRIEQKIPFPGKLTNDERMKVHEALIAEMDYRAKLLDVSRDVQMRYYQLYLTDRQLALANESVGILKNALRSAQARLASAQSSALDVFMAQTELEKAENNQFGLQQERRLIQLEFNTLLNQDLEMPLNAAASPELADLPMPLKDLQAIARREDPLYLSSLHETNHARAMLRRNRLEFAPDFGVMYEREDPSSGPAGRQIGVSVSLPIWFQRP